MKAIYNIAIYPGGNTDSEPFREHSRVLLQSGDSSLTATPADWKDDGSSEYPEIPILASMCKVTSVHIHHEGLSISGLVIVKKGMLFYATWLATLVGVE